MAALLRDREVQLEFVLDEGGPLMVDGLRPFVTHTAVALVGTAEKVCTPEQFYQCLAQLV